MKRRSFTNTKPLTQEQVEDFDKLDLESFPLISDFFVELRLTNRKFGHHLYYVSREFGDLITFPWWDHADRDLKCWTLKDIPTGTKTEPYYDMEQGWQLIIFREHAHVYLLQGGEPEDKRTVFHTWFRVLHQDYVDKWNDFLRQGLANYE